LTQAISIRFSSSPWEQEGGTLSLIKFNKPLHLNWFELSVIGFYLLMIVASKAPEVKALFGDLDKETKDAWYAICLSISVVYLAIVSTRALDRIRKEQVLRKTTQAALRESRARLKDCENREARASEDLAALAHEFNDKLYDLMKLGVEYDAECANPQSIDIAKFERELNHLMADFNSGYLNGVAKYFSTYTGDPSCASCIKAHNWDGAPSGNIKTLCRDNRSGHERVYDNKLDPFHYKMNTAFKQICDEDSDTYVCDDLDEAERNGKYQSLQNNRTYHATLVSAIRRPKTTDRKNIVGFLCVDNKTGNLDNEVARRSISILALNYFTFFEAGKNLERRIKNCGSTA